MSGHDADHLPMVSPEDEDAARKGRLFVLVGLAYTISVVCGVIAFFTSLVIWFLNSVAAPPPAHVAYLGISIYMIVAAAWLAFCPIMFIVFVLLVIFERSIRRYFLIWSVSAIVLFNGLLAEFFLTAAHQTATSMKTSILLSTLVGAVACSITGWLLLCATGSSEEGT